MQRRSIIAYLAAMIWSTAAMAQDITVPGVSGESGLLNSDGTIFGYGDTRGNVGIGIDALGLRETGISSSSVGVGQRRYTLDEIDSMRQSLKIILSPVCFSICTNFYGSAAMFDAAVENQLRTYMANGTDPEELRRRAEGK